MPIVRGRAHKAAGDEEDRDKELDQALDSLDDEQLQRAIEEQQKKVAADAAQLGLHQVTTPTEKMLSQANENAIAWALERSAELVKGIDQTTKDRLAVLVASAESEGWSNETLAGEIEDGDVFSAQRAETIARTETAAADVSGNLIGWKESGVVSQKEWIVADSNECDECSALNGTRVALDDEFDGGDPPLHPNCRCDVLPIVDDDQD